MNKRQKVVIVFGEDENDCRAIVEIARGALKSESGIQVKFSRTPVVHMRQSDQKKTRLDTAQRIIRLLRAEALRHDVVSVIAHQDCDAVEPAHISAADLIESELRKVGIKKPIAAPPAWETETWLMQFPSALAATRNCWNAVDYGKKDLGQISNSKERLRTDLRPKAQDQRNRCRDYSESDAPSIAKHARLQGLVLSKRSTKCASYDEFISKVGEVE